jgi:hypothetical protein
VPDEGLPMTRENLSAEMVAALARLQGLPLADAAMAERIAVGAGAAIEAVRVELARLPQDPSGNLLFGYEPGDFLLALERLADAAPGATGSG